MQQVPLFTVLIACATNLVASSAPAKAELINITNAGFEDTTGQVNFNEFTFGVPAGWTAYDPNFISGPGVFTGTLQPNGVDFFDVPAPEGDRVAILFNSTREGDGEYGFQQTLTETWQAETRYELSVQVGNIASGVSQNGTFFNLDEFPGYRVELLAVPPGPAAETVVIQDNNSLAIAEGQFGLSTLEITTGGSEAFLGQNIGIRLVNLNLIPAGFDQATSPDLEVDFDAVTLNAFAASVPEPGAFGLLAMLLPWVGARRRRSR